jgi:hypothetical protein
VRTDASGCRVVGPIGGFRTLTAFARWMLAGLFRHVEDAAATVYGRRARCQPREDASTGVRYKPVMLSRSVEQSESDRVEASPSAPSLP